MQELQIALIGGDETDIFEEIADVEIMIAQIKLLLGWWDDRDIEEKKRFNVDRQLKRIAAE